MVSKIFMMNFFKLILMFFVAVSCSSGDSHRKVYIADSEYKKVVYEQTRQSQAYEGLVNVIDIRVTLLNSKVRAAQTLKRATNMQWSEAEVKADQEYQAKDMAAETKIFLSFFTPESKDDNLSKPDTLWRLFLDVQGKRYAGTIQKLHDTPSEIMDLYPDHTKWGTPYIVKFLVPTRLIEENPSKFTITGAIGSTSVDFK